MPALEVVPESLLVSGDAVANAIREVTCTHCFDTGGYESDSLYTITIKGKQKPIVYFCPCATGLQLRADGKTTERFKNIFGDVEYA